MLAQANLYILQSFSLVNALSFYQVLCLELFFLFETQYACIHKPLVLFGCDRLSLPKIS